MRDQQGLPPDAARAIHALRSFGYRACVRLLQVDADGPRQIRRMRAVLLEGGMREVAHAEARREMIGLSDALDELLRLPAGTQREIARIEGVAHAASSDATAATGGGRKASALRSTPSAAASKRSPG